MYREIHPWARRSGGIGTYYLSQNSGSVGFRDYFHNNPRNWLKLGQYTFQGHPYFIQKSTRWMNRGVTSHSGVGAAAPTGILYAPTGTFLHPLGFFTSAETFLPTESLENGKTNHLQAKKSQDTVKCIHSWLQNYLVHFSRVTYSITAHYCLGNASIFFRYVFVIQMQHGKTKCRASSRIADRC